MPFSYSDYELMFGPLLLEKKGPVFTEKWQDYLHRQAGVLDQISGAKQPPRDKIKQLQGRMRLVKEALNDD